MVNLFRRNGLVGTAENNDAVLALGIDLDNGVTVYAVNGSQVVCLHAPFFQQCFQENAIRPDTACMIGCQAVLARAID